MKILIADLDKNFISDIQRSWSIPDTDFVVCSDRDAFMPLTKNQPLTFSIKGIGAVKCDGRMNIPDGEVYTAPVRESMNGKV